MGMQIKKAPNNILFKRSSPKTEFKMYCLSNHPSVDTLNAFLILLCIVVAVFVHFKLI